MMFVAGISFKTAPVELREQLAVIPSRLIETAAPAQGAGRAVRTGPGFDLQPGGTLRCGRAGGGIGRIAGLARAQ